MSTRHICSIFALSLSGTFSYSQVTTATLYVSVVDSSGAAVPEASVTVKDEHTGAVRTQVGNANGECSFTFLAVGLYSVLVHASGFKTVTLTGLALESGQNERRRVQLDIGSVTELLEVSADSPLVNTVSSEQRETVKASQLSELPTRSRRASDLFSMGTSIQRTGGTTNTSGSFVMNGLGRGGTSITMDGVPASGHPSTPQAGIRGGFSYIEVVSLEAIEEVSVAKGAFAAEYGHALAGNINVITKSGTNQLHGSLFYAFNAEELNARPTFLTSRPPVTFNQFGGSLGGKIIKDKLFLFGVYEGYRERRFATHEGQVPTARLRNDMISRFPEYQLILDHFYLPNQPHDPNGATGTYIGPASLRGNTNHFLVKPDGWITSTMRLSGTWLRDRPDRLEPYYPNSPGPNSYRGFLGRIDRLNVSFTTFGSNWSSEVRVGRNRVDIDRRDQLISVTDPNKQSPEFGSRSIPAISALGIQKFGELNFLGNVPHWIIEPKLTLERGRHSLKLGGIWNRRGFGGENRENPTLTYNTEQELLNNTPVAGLFTFGTRPYVGRAQNWGVFVQDDWKLSPKLVLNLGYRYDYFGRMTVKGLDGSPSPALYNPGFTDLASFTLGPFQHTVQDAYESDGMNHGARLGFSYNPDGAARTVFRGGFGVMFMAPNLSIFEQNVVNSPSDPFRIQLGKADLERLNIRFPAYSEDVLELVRGGTAAPAYSLIDPKLKAPYALNFTFGIQHALTRTTVLESAFVGSRGVKLINQRYYNQPDPLTAIRPNPSLGQGPYWDNSDTSIYTSWQTSLRKRYSNHLGGTVHYTWGKCLAYVDGDTTFSTRSVIQDFFDIRSNRGRCRDSIQNSLVANSVFDLPALANRNWLIRSSLGGWQISGILRAMSGIPITIDQSSSRNHSRPDLVNFNDAVLDHEMQWLNPAAFSRVPTSPLSGQTIRPGSSGNNVLNTPTQWNMDVSLGKNFRITESLRFQFRADMLNSFNHVDFISIVTRVNQANFGAKTGATDPRVIQFHLRLAF